MDVKIDKNTDPKEVKKAIRKKLGKNYVIEHPEKRAEAVEEMLGGLQLGLSFFSAVPFLWEDF